MSSQGKKRPKRDMQLTLFSPEHPVLEELRALDLNALAPLDAQVQLKKLQDQAK